MMNTEVKTTEQQQDIAFDNKINNMGRITSIMALIGMFMVPVVITLVYKIDVDWSVAGPLAGTLIAMFAPTAIVENISYYAVLGAGGVYLSCITGNIMNMKLPCALSGMQIAKVEPGSKKGDIISIISIGVSSLVTTIIIFLGMMIVGQFLAPLLDNPVLKPGFDNIMPALMGAIAVPQVLRNPKIAAGPLILAVAAYFILGKAGYSQYQSYLLLGIMLASVGISYLMYKKGVFEKKA